MIEVDNEKEAFITIDGQKLYGLQDLLIWLYNADQDKFNYHKDHFLEWIKNALKEEVLYEKIKEAKDKDEYIKIIGNFLKAHEIYVKKKLSKEEAEVKFSKLLGL
ncbi:MAG: hypothetical protein RQ869_01055 [Candidatus Nanopusillus sp.]|jgi:hypothetical protein|nr:hypothetical protein [Candidatus Nanopusillus sp.]